MNFCWNIFSSICYDITGVTVTKKTNIGQWVAVQNRLVETRDSSGDRGNQCMPVHGHGEHTPKIISFTKACDSHTQSVSLTSRAVSIISKMMNFT